MKTKKYSKKFEEDWSFYNRQVFDLLSKNIKNIGDENGHSAKECFFHLDSSGQFLPCREKELLQKIVNSKVSFNLQIKMWAEGIADLTLDIEELREYCEYFQCPHWAFSAVINQASSIISKLPLEEKKEKRNLILRLVFLQN
jgi:hypothetical protein